MNHLHLLYKRDTGVKATADISLDLSSPVDGGYLFESDLEDLTKYEAMGEEVVKTLDIDRIDRHEIRAGDWVEASSIEGLALPNGDFYTADYVEWLEEKLNDLIELM